MSRNDEPIGAAELLRLLFSEDREEAVDRIAGYLESKKETPEDND